MKPKKISPGQKKPSSPSLPKSLEILKQTASRESSPDVIKEEKASNFIDLIKDLDYAPFEAKVKQALQAETHFKAEDIVNAITEGHVSTSGPLAKLVAAILQKETKEVLTKSDSPVKRKIKKNKFFKSLISQISSNLREVPNETNIIRKVLMIDFLYALKEVGVINTEILDKILTETSTTFGSLPIKLLLSKPKPKEEEAKPVPLVEKKEEPQRILKDEEKKSELRIKGLLKTYLTGNESQHNIHHYWEIFTASPAIKKRLLSIILKEGVKLEQTILHGKTKVVTGLVGYLLKLLENIVISIPEVISQSVQILKEFKMDDEDMEVPMKTIQELFKVVTVKWGILQEIIETMDIINGDENEQVMKMKIQIITAVLKTFKFGKRNIEDEINSTRRYLLEKGADAFISYFDTELS